MKKNFVDKALEVLKPSVARRRYQERMRIDALERVDGIRKYEGGTKGRNTDDWRGVSSSSNIEVQTDIVTLRNRSRELARNNGYIKNWLRIMPNNIVGTGIIPAPVIITGKAKPERVKDVWKMWAEKTVCDYDQRRTLYGIQHLIVKTVLQSGECLIVRRRATSKYAIPLRLQVLEGDFIDSGKFSLYNEYGGITWYGIEFNGQGERVGYWLWDRHPGEFATESKRVDAKDVIHIYDVDRPGQIRGVPEAHAVMIDVKDLDDYEYSERQRLKIASCLVGAIQQDDDGKDSLASSFDTMEPGTWHRLKKGETVTFNSVPAGTGYQEYVNKNLHGISAGVGTTYEALTGDLSGVNFSSGRMGWLEFSRNISFWQWNVLVPALDTLFDWFIEAAQVAGALPLNAKIGCTWTAPRREMIDPFKEMKALTEEVRGKFKSWHEAVRERGDNPEDILQELKKEKEIFEQYGLKPASFPEFDVQREAAEVAAQQAEDDKLAGEEEPTAKAKKIT